MQSSRIEQEIDDIFDFVESCRMQRLSSTKVVIPKDELYDLLDDLRRDIPDEIKKYQKVLRQREKILDDAKSQADTILSDAQEQYKALVEEHAIMQEAYQQADITLREANEQAAQIVANARKQAEEIGNGAIYYTRDMLEQAEQTMAAALEAATNNARALEAAMQGHLDIIRQNKSELVIQDSEVAATEQSVRSDEPKTETEEA
jgi:cell division septum initiation protein DivIVA